MLKTFFLVASQSPLGTATVCRANRHSPLLQSGDCDATEYLNVKKKKIPNKIRCFLLGL